MKKTALFLSLVLMAIACQEKVDVVAPEVNFGSPDLVIPYEGSEDESLKIEFKANVDWTAELDKKYDWLQLAKTSGPAGDAAITVIALENESRENRGAVVKVIAGISTLKFNIVQLGTPFISVSKDAVAFSPKGGTEELQINSNASFVISDSGEEWMQTEFDPKTGVLKIAVDPYAQFAGREASITIENNLEGLSQTIAVSQSGRSTILWKKDYAADLNQITLGASNRLAVKGDYLLVSAGANAVHVLNKKTGEYVKSIALPAGADVTNIANDDAGNIIIGADVAQGASVDFFYVSDMETLSPVKLLTVTGDIYGTCQTNIRVSGDVTKDAALAMIVGGAPSYGGSFYWAGWDIKNGVVGERQFGAIPSEAGEDMWNGQTGCVLPLGTSIADGLVATWYPSTKIRYSMNPTAEGAQWGEILFDGFTNGCNSALDFCTFGGNNYLLAGVGAWWNYSPSGFYLFDVTDLSNPNPVFSFESGYIDVNNAGSCCDVLGEVVGDKLNVYFTDNNKGVIVCVEIQ